MRPVEKWLLAGWVVVALLQGVAAIGWFRSGHWLSATLSSIATVSVALAIYFGRRRSS